MKYLEILEARDMERLTRQLEEATMVTHKPSDLVNMISSIFDDWKSRKHNQQEIAELLGAMGYRIKMDGERAELIKEAPGDIRKFLAGAAIIAGLWGVNNHVAQQAYEDSPQLQKLVQLHQQAQSQGNDAAAENYADRIEQHKLRLDLGKGEVMGADGRPKQVKQFDEVNVNGLSPEEAAKKKARDAHMKGDVKWGGKDSKKVKKEEVEQIDELERSTIAKYAMGSSADRLKSAVDAYDYDNKAKDKKQSKDAQQSYKKMASDSRARKAKRQQGIDLAMKKLDRVRKEEVEQVDESYDDDDAFFEAYGWLEDNLEEAEYQGRKVKLNKPMQGTSKKFKVYVKDPKTGNVKVVHFGHGGSSVKGKAMKIRKNNPKARKSFRARHNCDNPGPKTKARYWSCRAW